MTDCCDCEPAAAIDHAYRRVLWVVLILNTIMFGVETVAGYLSRSSALQADAVDFLGDALNYISALYVLNKSLKWRSSAAMIKGGVIGLFGIFILSNTLYHWLHGTLPAAETMGVVGLVAFLVNISCSFLLFRFRNGDSNRSSVWICSRNDAIANILVILAGVGVYYSGSQLPDLIVSFLISGMALSGAIQIMRKAMKEFSE